MMDRRLPKAGVGKWLQSFVKWKIILPFILAISVIWSIPLAWSFIFSGSTFKENSTGIVEQIRDLQSLATAEATSKAVIGQEDNQLFGKDIGLDIPGTKREFLVIFTGTVLAGVDLNKMNQNDITIDEKEKTLDIRLPKAEILETPSINYDDVQTFSVEGLFRSEVNWEEGYELAEKAQAKIEQEAIEQGVLETAEDNAIKTFTQFFNELGYETTVVIED
ncbi:DUF4230 domain-containing protein [Bacillus coahuilensis]|uniref:DUF4230 domain-containing protein n=1 Tax=Bacillus coahuilensis TaxID=408580 RepID=UPI0007507C59|nr:DUF4230 domain-containing protein [Bacillus coahuilensis]